MEHSVKLICLHFTQICVHFADGNWRIESSRKKSEKAWRVSRRLNPSRLESIDVNLHNSFSIYYARGEISWTCNGFGQLMDFNVRGRVGGEGL